MEEDAMSKHLSSTAMPVATAASWFMAMALASAQEPNRLNGADLFVDLEQYVGKQVILVDAGVVGATDSGAFVRAGGVMFYVNGKDIDRETFQFFLTNCTGRRLFAWPYGGVIVKDICKVPLSVIPTAMKTDFSFPVLKSVRIAKPQGNQEPTSR
jgi:hypothetical protein